MKKIETMLKNAIYNSNQNDIDIQKEHQAKINTNQQYSNSGKNQTNDIPEAEVNKRNTKIENEENPSPAKTQNKYEHPIPQDQGNEYDDEANENRPAQRDTSNVSE